MSSRFTQAAFAVVVALVASACGPDDPADHAVMEWSGPTRELAREIERMIIEGDGDDIAALRHFDAQHPTFALDAAGRVGCLLDVPTGRCHVLKAPSRPRVTSPTADEELLAAMEAALPTVESRSFMLSITGTDECRRLTGVHVVAEEASRTSFVLRPDGPGEPWFRYDVGFEGAIGYILRDVTADDLAAWRKQPGWPEEW